MKKIINILFLLLLCLPAFSQQDSGTEQRADSIKIHFDHDKYVLNLDLSGNREVLEHFSDLLERFKSDTLNILSKIEISSYASPEGGRLYNKKLSEKRTNTIYDYLTKTLSVPDSLIERKHSGADWVGLQALVENSDIEYRDEILEILRDVPEETWKRLKPTDRWMTLVDSRNKHLMDLKYGEPYRYMFANVYPKLRRGSVVTIYTRRRLPAQMRPELGVSTVEQFEPKIIPVTAKPIIEPWEREVPLFALKTNLLFDAATMINVELEIPIGDRWSIAGEWIFPWWTTCGGKNNAWSSSKDNPRNTLEVLNGNIEAKYWLGDRSNYDVMTGWNVGLYAGGGLYDLELNAKGYQGEFFLAAGLSAGYAHTINKRGNLRMEYSFGIGYLQTKYRKYEEHWGINDKWHTMREYSGSYSWFGPTRARVSLVWLLTTKKKGGSIR